MSVATAVDALLIRSATCVLVTPGAAVLVLWARIRVTREPIERGDGWIEIAMGSNAEC